MQKTHALLNDDIVSLLKLVESYGFTIMLVGGCVRDYLYFQNIDSITDIDMATDATTDDLISIFRAHNLQYIKTGISYGTITLIYNKKSYQVTTLRQDIKTYGRKADISYTSSFQQDSNRRDFTINALYMDKTGTVHDYHNGMKDLQNGTIQFIGNAEQRIQEDYLRILRYFRFSAKFSQKHFDAEYLQIIKSNLSGIACVSSERIINELLKIFNINNIYTKKYGVYIFDTLNYLFGISFDLLDAIQFLKINQYLNNVDLIGLLCILGNQTYIRMYSSLPKKIHKYCNINFTNNHCVDFRIQLKHIPKDCRMFAMCVHLIYLYKNKIYSINEINELKIEVLDYVQSKYLNFIANNKQESIQNIIERKNHWKQRVFYR